MLKRLVEESNMFEKLKFSNPKKYTEEISSAIKSLLFILNKKADNLINIYKLDEEVEDFDLTILRALINSK